MAAATLRMIGSRLVRIRLRSMRIFGLTISLHWSWFPCVILWSVWGAWQYSSRWWALGEIVGVFLIVLLHEIGHVIAARRSGLLAQEVVLWPLGGLAFIDPPRQWKAELLVASAGPVVNLVLVPMVFLLWYWIGYRRGGDISQMLWSLGWANAGMLLLNLLPIWPLDGGRVIQSLLSARIGITRSRLASAFLGLIFGAVGIGWFTHIHAFIGVVLLASLVLVSATTLQWSLQMLSIERIDGVHAAAICPHCGGHAINRPNATCKQCGEGFNALTNAGRCWNCGTEGEMMKCFYCNTASRILEWSRSAPHSAVNLERVESVASAD